MLLSYDVIRYSYTWLRLIIGQYLGIINKFVFFVLFAVLFLFVCFFD